VKDLLSAMMHPEKPNDTVPASPMRGNSWAYSGENCEEMGRIHGVIRDIHAQAFIKSASNAESVFRVTKRHIAGYPTCRVIMSEDVTGQVSAIEVEFDPLNNVDEIKVSITWMRVDSYQFPDGNKIHFYKIPIKLCYAVTAHKAQGQTLSKLAVSIMDEAFAYMWPSRVADEFPT
jgi:hypothetical protein